MEELRRYFESFEVVYIQDQCGNSEILPYFRSICPKFREYRLYEPDLSQLALEAHLMILEIPRPIEDDIVKIREILKNSNYWECLILSDDFKNYSLSRIAFSHSIVDILPRKLEAPNLHNLTRFLLGKLITRKKERLAHEYHRRLIEQEDRFFLIRHKGKTVFANRPLQRYTQVKQPSEIDSLNEREIPLLAKLKEFQGAGRQVWQNPYNKETFLIEMGAENENGESMGVCWRVDSSFYREKRQEPLTRIRFTEAFKDRLVVRNVNDENLYLLCIKIENGRKILEDFGALALHEFSKELVEYSASFAQEEEPLCTFWNRDFLVFLLENRQIIEIKKRVTRLFQAIPSYDFTQGIVPFVDLAVIDFRYLSPNDSLFFLDRFYEKNYTPQEGKRIMVRLSSAMYGEGDENRQAMFYLENIHSKEQTIRILNLYKGLSVHANTKILKIKEGDIYVRAEKIQRCLMNIEKKIVIESANLPRDIRAEVKYVDKERSFAILCDPVFMEFSANNRQYSRVQCDIRIPITLSSGRYAYTGEIIDISIQAIAIRYRSTISRNILQSEARLHFSLPNISFENSLVKLAMNGKVVAIKPDEDGRTRVVVMIRPESPHDGYLLEYIYARQKELMQEIKKIGNLAFR